MDEYIYIFLHIPRTGGTTLKWHIERNFSEEERLPLYTDALNVLNNRKKSYKPADYRELVDRYVSEIPRKRKDKIKIVYGHYSIYGLHKKFDKKVRYITFLRKPEDRIISFYNYLYHEYHKENYLGKKQPKYKYGLLTDGKPAALNQWILKLIKSDDYMSLWIDSINIFYKLGYLRSISNSKDTLVSCLKIFYFIGITEFFNIDSLIFYKLLNLNRFYKRKNVSVKHVEKRYIGIRNSNYKTLLDRNERIYDLAVYLNGTFKDTNKDLVSGIETLKLKRKFILPVSQNIDTFSNKIKTILYNLRGNG
jgi:hypothetical protein